MGPCRREFKVAGQTLLELDCKAVNHSLPWGRDTQQREQRWLTKSVPHTPPTLAPLPLFGASPNSLVINGVPITQQIKW